MSGSTLNRLRNMFPRRLARVRGERSQRQFAHNLGVFQQNVNRYENGTMPHANFLLTLAVKEDISLDWLLLGRGNMRYAGK
jgi:transcriptional regulator with XRE-family HTH domain